VIFDWETAALLLVFQTGVAESDRAGIVAHSVTDLKCPRLLPWGPSSSVNRVRLDPLPEGQLLTIEMQSGDLLEIRCREVAVKPVLEEAQ
jgi:hypothetical protein